jgi:putative ABC transport system permease protein
MPVSRTVELEALRVYRAALWLYPSEFRTAYGRELCLFFSDRCREAHTATSFARVCWATGLGVLREAPKEHGSMIRNDLRHALRLLRHDRLLTAAAITILALGTGAATLVFGIANGLLLRPLPYPHLETLVAVAETSPKDPAGSRQVSFANSLDLRARSRLLLDIGTYEEGDSTIRDDGDAEAVEAAEVSDGIFNVLGIRPLLGRTFSRNETTLHGPLVTIISSEVWKRRYGGNPRILGRTLEIDGASHTVIGVMPAGFHFPDRVQLWLPQQIDPTEVHARTSYHLRAIARMRPQVTVEQATAELRSLLLAIHHENPETDNGYSIRAESFRRFVTDSYRKGVLILLLAVVFLLLVACANVSNLLLVRASARQREIAVRTAIGATRGRLVRQLLVEGVLFGLLGGGLGLILASVGTPALVALIPAQLPRWVSFSMDVRVFGFALGISVLTSVLFGLAPAASAFGHSVTEALKDGGGSGSLRRQRRLRDALVIAEVALSFVLLAGAGLMVRSFWNLRTQNLGYQSTRALSIDLGTPQDAYPLGPKYRALIDRIGAEVRTLPGVTAVSFSSGVPLNSNWKRIFTIEGRPVKLEDMPGVYHVVVTPGYFETLGIPLLQGRTFTEADWNQPIVIVTRDFARKHWPNENAVGKRIRFGPPTANEPWHTVVGIVATNRQGDLKDDGNGNVYIARNGRFDTANLLVRSSGDPHRLVQAIHARIAGVDHGVAMMNVRTLDELIELASWRDRLLTVLFTAFAVLALLLAAGGLYAALAYTVALQTREIGIRVALGASLGRVRVMVLRQGLALIGIGLGLGLAAAAVLTRLVGAELYGVSSFDPVTYLVAPSVLIVAGLIAAMVPTRRATAIDPVEALRRQ